ncbi:MAG: c-type cytochrome [Deltaproteobacteria bacterium]|nr:c-type cytochrome [Deltaproteobacteria bacterium]
MKRTSMVLSLCLSLTLGFAAVGSAADGKALYEKCAGCHGADGAKKALGIGKPIKGMSEADLTTALNGYKAKNYGGEKKAMMERQAEKLSAEDISALAGFISKL